MANDVTLKVGADTSSADKSIASFEGRSRASFAALSAAASTLGNVAADAIGKGLEVAAEGAKKLAETTLELVRATNTVEVQRLQTAWTTLKDTFVESARQSSALASTLEALTQAATGISQWAASSDGRQAIDEYFRTITSGAALALQGVDLLYRTMQHMANLSVLITDPARWYNDRFKLGQFPAQSPEIETLISRLDSAASGGFQMTPQAPSPFYQLGGTPESSTSNSQQRGPSAQDKLMAQALEIARKQAHEASSARVDQAIANAPPLPRSLSAETLKREREAYQLREIAAQRHANAMEGIYSSSGEAIGAVVGSMTDSIATLASGGDVSFAQFMGRMVVALGTYVFQTGAAALAIGLVDTIMGNPRGPILLGIAGGTMAAGAGIIAAGTAMGGGTGQSSPTSPSAPGGSSVRRGATLPDRLDPIALPGRTGTRVYNVTFTGPVGGSPRRVARDLQSALEGLG